MTHDEAFIQAIIDSPDDDAPRLIYADWLEERGDPRGEFIRVQCALAGMDEFDPRRWDLMARERELRQTHEDEWLGSCRGCLHDWRFQRGFLDRATMEGPDFFKCGGELLRLGPDVEVRLISELAALPRALGQPLACQLKRLALFHSKAGDRRLSAADAALLASSPALTGLTSLEIDSSDIGPEGVRSLAQAPWLSGLRELKLAHCGIAAAGVEALAACPALSGLESLELPHNGLTVVAVQMLAEAVSLTRLRRLNLSHNQIGPHGFLALAMNPRFAGLEALELAGNRGSGNQLARSPHLRRLAHLGLANCRLDDGGVRALMGSPVAESLRSLDLSGNHLFQGRSLRVASVLSALKGSPGLTRLNLSGNEIGDEGAQALAMLPALAGLRWLGLGVNGLRVWGVRHVTASPHLSNLHTLDLRSNLLEDRGLQVFARWPGLARLAVLNVHGNGIGDVGARELASSTYLGALREMDVSDNRIGPEGIAALRASPLGEASRVSLKLDN